MGNVGDSICQCTDEDCWSNMPRCQNEKCNARREPRWLQHGQCIANIGYLEEHRNRSCHPSAKDCVDSDCPCKRRKQYPTVELYFYALRSHAFLVEMRRLQS